MPTIYILCTQHTILERKRSSKVRNKTAVPFSTFQHLKDTSPYYDSGTLRFKVASTTICYRSFTCQSWCLTLDTWLIANQVWMHANQNYYMVSVRSISLILVFQAHIYTLDKTFSLSNPSCCYFFMKESSMHMEDQNVRACVW